MVKIFVALRFRISFNDSINASPRIRAHYEQLSEFERGRVIRLKEAGWANRRITRHMIRSDVVMRRFLQEWVDSGRYQRHDVTVDLRP
ncbi:HTH_Tnp_Tc3_2 domain-containing protein [Trichonephila clavipes]|nr:HTH_Tnp_Tc3_2 domain-containing protein [Trichonephila clavipes]